MCLYRLLRDTYITFCICTGFYETQVYHILHLYRILRDTNILHFAVPTKFYKYKDTKSKDTLKRREFSRLSSNSPNWERLCGAIQEMIPAPSGQVRDPYMFGFRVGPVLALF